MKKNKNLKLFLISMLSTTYILALITGFITIEKSAQKIINKNATNILDYSIENGKIKIVKFNLMGKDLILNF